MQTSMFETGGNRQEHFLFYKTSGYARKTIVKNVLTMKVLVICM